MLSLIGKSTKVHLYYCMKNCNLSGDILRKNILNIVKHYQVSTVRQNNVVRINYTSTAPCTLRGTTQIVIKSQPVDFLITLPPR